MSNKSIVSNLLTPASRHFGEPVALRGSDITQFSALNGMHTADTGMALGVNTSGLYSKKKSEERLSSTISILLRIYSAFPQHMPRLTPPSIDELIAKIQAIDPTFKKSYFGSLLGLETNSSFRLRKNGTDKTSQTVRNLLYVIDLIITNSPENWPALKEIVEIEAESRSILPPESVWSQGGWKRELNGLQPRKRASKKATMADAAEQPIAEQVPASTARKPVRRQKVNKHDEPGSV